MAFENVDYTSLSVPAAPFSDPSRIPDFPKGKVPRHIGVIMDGNGRWAQQRGLIRTEGHQAAEPVVFDTIAGAIEAGVRYLSLYTFSTENWKRSPQEVRFLMGFSRDIIRRRVAQMDEWGVRVRWSGRRPKLWKSVIDELESAMERTKHNKVIDVVFCINYGGRAEIADACAAIAREVRDGRISGDRVTEKMVAEHLYNSDIPDCDLVIRAHLELPAVAGRLRRARLRARTVPRLRPRGAVAFDRPLHPPRSPVRRRQEVGGPRTYSFDDSRSSRPLRRVRCGTVGLSAHCFALCD